MAVCHKQEETAVATASTQANGSVKKAAMVCVCCWTPIQDLTRHYRTCSYIQGDWAFWACPYTLETLHDKEAFKNHIKSFKPDEKRIAVTPNFYVTARTWAMRWSGAAKKRQLVNTVFAYFNDNPGLVDEWKALNNGELVPNLNNGVDVGEVLEQSSTMLRRRSTTGFGHLVEQLSIDELRDAFYAGNKAVTKTPTELDAPSKKRRRNDTPVSFTALEFVNKEVKVKIGDARFNGAELAHHQQQQLGGQNPECSLGFGGVLVHSPSILGALAPVDAASTPHAPTTLGYQTQRTFFAPNNVSSNPAEVQYGLQNYLTNNSGVELPPAIPQRLQQRQGVDVPAGVKDPSSTSDDCNQEDDDLDYWISCFNSQEVPEVPDSAD